MSAIIIFAASKSMFAGLPAGYYFRGCANGVYGIYNMLFNLVRRIPGPCPANYYFYAFVVRPRVSNPPPPYLTDPTNPVWEGKTAWEWIGILKTGVDDTGVTASISNPNDLPTLYCNEADFD